MARWRAVRERARLRAAAPSAPGRECSSTAAMATGQWSRNASVPMKSPRWPPEVVCRVMRSAGVETARASAKTCSGGVM
jgi:hypothetical protein